MYCSACGTLMEDHEIRCRKCRRLTPGAWLNLYSLSLIVSLGVINAAHMRFIFPIVVNMAYGMGFALPLPMRIYAGVSHGAQLWGWLLIPAALIWMLWRKSQVRVPMVLRSGKVMALVAAAGILITIVGTFLGYIEVVKDMPRFIR